MNVSINNELYEDVQWGNGLLTMETNMTLAQIEAKFIPGEDADIIVYEGEEEIARYYNKGLSYVTVKGTDPRVVDVMFDITQITPNAEEEIRSDIEDSDGAIVELAEIVADLSSLDLDNMAAELQSHQETLNTWFSHASEIGQFINDLRKEGGILDQFNLRITALEQIIGVESIEQVNEEEGE